MFYPRFLFQYDRFLRNQTGDVACDSYHKIDEDIKIVKALGLSHYRFSIAWTRIVPDGHVGTPPNAEGIKFYNDTINKLLAAGIEPMMTLFHWDTPATLQEEFGGFNDSRIIDPYVYYADICFKNFGDRVKHWFTFNEPYTYCWLGHGLGISAPGVHQLATGPYNCGHNMIKAHAAAYHR